MRSAAIPWKGAIPFLSVHLMCLWAFQTGISWELVALAAGSYYLRMFAITAGYHRYFSHRSYKTSRVFQFLLAVLCCGEGWHNNHHYYQSSVNQGWRWWEVDLSYYVLTVLFWFGIVWDLRTPPVHIKAKVLVPEYTI